MSQDPQNQNMYNPMYSSQQQPGGYAPYPPPEQPGGYAPYPPQPGTGYGSAPPFQPPPVIPRPQPFPKDDEHVGEWGNFSGLENKEIRRIFVRKVYIILMFQLLVTFGIIALFHYTTSIRTYIKSSQGQWLYWTSFGVFLVTYLALACCKSVARRFPINLLFLALLTLAMSYMMGVLSAFYTINSVLLAVGITAFVCFGVTLFSFQTKYDFTSCIGVMFVVSLALLGFGFLCIFTYSTVLYTVYAGLGAVAFSIFLAIDTQLIIGGKRHEISAEDHVFASIMLYLDIVYIFMYILMLLGKRE